MVRSSGRSPEPQRASMEESPDRPSRKVSSYGGSRAWSEEEEAYLLEARQRKTPYKHIATHLQKTELACRLHFHQLAYGAKRKRRSTSASSASTGQGNHVSTAGPSEPAQRGHASQRSVDSIISKVSTDPSWTSKPTPKMRLAHISPPTSPPPAQRRRLARSESPIHDGRLHVPGTSISAASSTIPASSTFSPFPTAHSMFPVLPHINSGLVPSLVSPSACSNTSAPPPILSYDAQARPQFDDASNVPSRFAAAPSHHRLQMDSRLNQHRVSAPPMLGHPLGQPSSASIDTYRLSGIYNRNRSAFWVEIAREYGGNVSPSALEAAILRQSVGSPSSSSLPTPPNRSPVMLAVNVTDDQSVAEKGKLIDLGKRRGSEEDEKGSANCSIASLLTEDKEVWQRGKTA